MFLGKTIFVNLLSNFASSIDVLMKYQI